MAQFIRKNRKKRKYLRHKKVEKKVIKKVAIKPVKNAEKKVPHIKLHKPTIHIPSITRPRITKPSRNTIRLVKNISLAVVALGTLAYLLQHITIPQVDIPQDAIKNNVEDTFGFIGRGIMTVLDSIGNVLMGILWLLTQIWNWLVWVCQGIYHGLIILVSFIVFVLTKVFEGIMAFFSVLYVLIVQLLSFIWYVIVTITTAIINGIIMIWQFTSTQLGRFFYWLGTPFRTLGAFFEMMKPYLAILGHHIQGAFDVLHEGFKSLTSLGSL